MKRVSLFVVGLLSLVAGSAFGSIVTPVANETITFYVNAGGIVTGGNQGGPFYAVEGTGASQQTWKTYCVEAGNLATEESFVPGTTYKVNTFGGSIATNTNNIVTDAAKWLYYHAINGGVTGYAAGDYANETSMQLAIWNGVLNQSATGTLVSLNGPLSTAYASNLTAQAYFTQATAALVGGIWVGNSNVVGVLNPTTNGTAGGAAVQSMLYQVGQANEQVPEPASVIVWSVLSAGTAGFALVRRRRSTGR